MKLFEFKHQEDYGHDVYITLLKVRRWCLIQTCFSTMEYGRAWPYLNITLGYGRMFGFTFEVLSVGISFEVLSRSWFR
jgi:hypothetical protein